MTSVSAKLQEFTNSSSITYRPGAPNDSYTVFKIFEDTYADLFAGLKRTFKKLHDAGVNIAAGTDSGTPGVVIGRGLHKELELMVEAGISPMEAIMAGTKNAAQNLAKAGELGTVESGKLADVIAVSGDPLKSIGDTREIKLVIKDGEILINRIDT